MFSRLAASHPGERRACATALAHDTPAEASQPYARQGLEGGRGCAVPGKTMPALTLITRDYGQVYEKLVSLGPLVEELGVGAKGVAWRPQEEIEWLKQANGVVRGGVADGRPSMVRAEDAAEAILAISGITNGRIS